MVLMTTVLRARRRLSCITALLILPKTGPGVPFSQALGIEQFLGQQLSPTLDAAGIDRTGFNCRAHRAAGFALVLAIGEAAIQSNLGYISEHAVDTVFRVGKLEFAHPRRIDQPAAGWQPVQCPARCRMAAPPVVLSDALRCNVMAAGQRVDQRRFADPGRPRHRHRLPLLAPRQKAPHPCRVAAVDKLDQQVRLQGFGRFGIALGVRRGIGLGQYQHRCHGGLTGERQIAFQSRHIEVGIARRHDEQHVDIGGDQLHLPVAARRPALEQALPRKQVKGPVPALHHQHPIANRGPRIGLFAAHREGQNAALVSCASHLQPVAMYRQNAHRLEVALGFRVDLGSKEVSPAKFGQSH